MKTVAEIKMAIGQPDKIILSLFDYSGSWSKPYREAGYRVIQIDTQLGFDILTWDYQLIPREDVIGVLAAPPCTDFASSGAQYWPKKDKDGTTLYSLQLIEKTLEIIDYFQPKFWALENPVGRLRRILAGGIKSTEGTLSIPDKLRKVLKSKPHIWNPCDFGDPWTKKTLLWGQFNIPKTSPVKPISFSEQGSWTQVLGGKGIQTKRLRSMTPKGFARAFFNANSGKT